MGILEDLERLTEEFREMYTDKILNDKKVEYRRLLLMYDEGVKSIIKKYSTLRNKKPYIQTDIYDVLDEKR